MSHRGARDQRPGGWGTDANRRRRQWRPAIAELEERRLLSTFTVNNTGDGINEIGSLRWAVNQANANSGFADTINFDGTVFNTPKTITLALNEGGMLALLDPATTTITGPGAGLLTVSAGGTSGVFAVGQSASAALSGLTITGGNAGEGGGLNNQGSATLTGCAVSGNTAAGNGGGLFNGSNSITTLINCTVSGNRAGTSNKSNGNGGGLFNNGAATLTNCIVSGNTANAGTYYPGNGGGLANSGTATLTNCTISGNTAKNDGGAVFNTGAVTLTDSTVGANIAGFNGGGLWNSPNSKATLTNCTISGNSADPQQMNPDGPSGGGISNNGTVTLTNCTISGNSSRLSGGGLDNGRYGTATLTRCTISGNTSSNGGGIGIYNDLGKVILTDTIVAGNTGTMVAPNVDGPVTSGGHNLTDDPSGSSGWISSDLLGRNPRLSALGNFGGPTQTMALQAGSDAIGAGGLVYYPGTNTPITTDQRGFKIDSPTPDIGAFQVQSGALSEAAPPTVVGVQRFGIGHQPTILVFTFGAALEPSRARDVTNYRIVTIGGQGRGVARVGRVVRLLKAVYDPRTRTVALFPAERLGLRNSYQLTVRGTAPGGLTGATGLPLDGAGTGQPGHDFVRVIDRAALAGSSTAYFRRTRPHRTTGPSPLRFAAFRE